MKTLTKSARALWTVDALSAHLRSEEREGRSRSRAIGPAGWIAILSPLVALVTGASIAFAT